MNQFSELRGAGQLTVDGVAGLTDIVEALHTTIASAAMGPGPPGPISAVTRGVYGNIRRVSRFTGLGLDWILNMVSATGIGRESFGQREIVLAALNGILGDHLAATDNPLAIRMQLRHAGRALDRLSALPLGDKRKIAILVHGSCMHERLWNRDGQDHGAALARDLGYLPIYLRYNSGLHVSENGRAFSSLLETLLSEAPTSVDLSIVAFSMGGLVARSAFHAAESDGHQWVQSLRKIVFLGTPHHGVALERAGNWIDRVLEISPYTSPFARLGRIRSAGLTDLRYGNLIDDDWRGHDRFDHVGDLRTPIALPATVACYTIAAAIGERRNALADEVIGDGLVPLDSALGRHRDDRHNLAFPKSHQRVFRDCNHFDLLSRPDVYATLSRWL